FDPSRCNTNAGGKVGTTAVGSYPNGASAFGAEEMAGNVWEWTHSLYKPYPYTAGDEQAAERSAEIRVLRGGSWISDSQVARTAYRSLNGPADLDYNIGFRLVLGRASLA
ncbi:MAG TPA: SUMF1/EgtB/PvdO family nonheme iron enzyme, partial [Ktedonobacterales bacterium]